MGNQQSRDGPLLCTTTPHPLATRFMVDKDFRVDYITTKTRNTEVMRLTKQRQLRVVHQQRMRDSWSQQQKQEESVEISPKGPDMLKMPKINLEYHVEPEKVSEKESGKVSVFEGLFGDVSVLYSEVVNYTDSVGNVFHEKYDSEKIQKTFPMGISFGGLSKSLWFKAVEERDACFDNMTGIQPPSYAEVMANPEKYNIPEWMLHSEKDDDSCNIKVFDGIQGNDVVVYKDKHVDYTDLDGVKHSVSYNRHHIQKCFPHGICFGGLPRTVWLTDEIERDLCFMLMQFIGHVKHEKDDEKTFPGLYGSVILKDNQVSFTSLVGERITAEWYDAKSIYRVFPMGISGGGLPNSIWFKEMSDMEDCFEAMEQNCNTDC